MKKRAGQKPRLYRTSFDRQVEALLEKIRQELPPECGQDYVVINMESEEYVIGKTPQEAMAAYDERWPHGGFLACRADGGPFSKLYRRK